MDDFDATMALIVIGCAFWAGIMFGIAIEETRVETGRRIIIDNSSYQCKMVNTLKEN